MAKKLEVLSNVEEMKPDVATVELFETLLEKAKKGEVIGGIVICLEKNGEVTHWVKSSQARMADLVFGLKVTEHSLMTKFHYSKGE